MTLLNERGISNEINVTPLIDILLVLLIIFMVITPLTPRGLDALVPQPTENSVRSEPVHTVVIQVSKDGGGDKSVLHINGEAVEWNALSARLTKIFAARADKVAFVSADPDLNFEQVAAVIDAAHASGIDKIGLITKHLQGAS